MISYSYNGKILKNVPWISNTLSGIIALGWSVPPPVSDIFCNGVLRTVHEVIVKNYRSVNV
jgi:hypothetical protein